MIKLGIFPLSNIDKILVQVRLRDVKFYMLFLEQPLKIHTKKHGEIKMAYYKIIIINNKARKEKLRNKEQRG